MFILAADEVYSHFWSLNCWWLLHVKLQSAHGTILWT